MSPLAHARFLKWLSQAVRASNDAWRLARPDVGGEVVTRGGLVSHLRRWAVDSGRWPGGKVPRVATVAVAIVFEADPEAVKAEARRYWRTKVDEQTP